MSKRPSEAQQTPAGSVTPPKKKAAVAAKKKAEGDVLRRWKERVVASVSQGWEAAQAVLDEAVAAGQEEGAEVPAHLPYTLYSELGEVVPDAMLHPLVEYMNSDKLLDICRNPERRTPLPFLEGILSATKCIATRARSDPVVGGKAQLLQSRLGCIRHDVTMLNKSGFRRNEALDHAVYQETPLDSPVPELYEVLRTSYNLPLPDEKRLASDLKELQEATRKLVGLPEAELVTFSEEVAALIHRLLAAVQSCRGHVGLARVSAASPAPLCRLRPRLPCGDWDAVSLQHPGYQLEMHLLMDVVAGCVMEKGLEELGKGSARQGAVEGAVKVLQAARAAVSESLSGNAGAGGAAAAGGMRREFWREAAWVAWKRGGCDARMLDGAEQASKACREGKEKSRPKLSSPRERTNDVPLPSAPRVARPAAVPSCASYASSARAPRAALTLHPAEDGYAADNTPTPAARPSFHSVLSGRSPKSLEATWLAARLLALDDISVALDTESTFYWYTDPALFAKHISETAPADK